jgi:ubiquitin-protein ligase
MATKKTNAELRASRQERVDSESALWKTEQRDDDDWYRRQCKGRWAGFKMEEKFGGEEMGGIIPGHGKSSLWAGSSFRVSLLLPLDYPNEKPRVRFEKPIPYHPNIAADGFVRVETIPGWRSSSDWHPSRRCCDVLAGLRDLLDEPDTRNTSIARQEPYTLFMRQRATYDACVKRCIAETNAYNANLKLPSDPEVKVIESQGYPRSVGYSSTTGKDGTVHGVITPEGKDQSPMVNRMKSWTGDTGRGDHGVGPFFPETPQDLESNEPAVLQRHN